MSIVKVAAAIVILFSVCLALPVGARAGEIFVDQKNPAADDKNAGTEASPLKTIQAGLDKAQAGDSVEVRAGVYHEGVKFKRGGSYHGGAIDTLDPRGLKWLTLEAYKNEHVTLDGSLEIPASDWKLVDGCKNTYVAPFVNKSFNKILQMLFAGDELVLPTLVKNPDQNMSDRPMIGAMPGDKPEDSGWFYDKDKDQLYVNLGGRVPGKGALVSASQLDTGVDAACQTFFRVRRLEVRGFNGSGICVYNAQEFIVEDNYVHLCRSGVLGNPSGKGFVRRNILTDLTHSGMTFGGACGTVIEGNIIKRWHINPYRDNTYTCSLGCSEAFGLCIRYNVITENICPDMGGPWPDCAATGISAYGNTIYSLSGDGFYIEAWSLGTVLRWNTIFEADTGIAFRANCANVAFQNYIFNCRGAGLDIGSTDVMDVKPKADTMSYNWLIDNRRGIQTNPDCDKEIAHTFDHNTYKIAKDGRLFYYGVKQYMDIEELRKDLGVEIHGKVVTEFDPKSLGLVTFRVQGTKKEWQPVPMFGNPTMERMDVKAGCMESYFWCKGTFRDKQDYGWYVCGGVQKMTMHGADEGRGFLRQTGLWITNLAGELRWPGSDIDKNADDPTVVRGSNRFCLQVSARPGKTISPDGLGYWSVDLPTVDGAKIDVSAWMKAKGVKPASASGGVYLLAEFRDETGQNVSRQYVVGANDGDKAANPDFAAGTYDHKQAAGAVTAPKDARWFRVGFGVRDASGWASFNDIDIQTRPGVAPKEVARKARPIEPANFNWNIMDISKMLNRPLADEVAGDGKGGWTDQGSQMDLRELQAGEKNFNGVPFRVEKDNACFIMKSKYQPSEALPSSGKVELKAKADVLAFLHSGGFLPQDVQHATYIIHYADGTKVEIPIVSGKNILDWTSNSDVADNLKYDPAMGLLLHAVTVASPKFVRVNVWMLLWKNPHPDKDIAELEVRGANEGIPGLIAVSCGKAKK